jgi:iron-only hydrogenase group A
MEEASELVHRITNNGALPMLTSCSPGWIKFVEQFYPEMIDNISTCKSPQQMLGSVIKTYFAKKNNIDPSKIYSVSIMPCTAKKFEAQRPEHLINGLPAVDAVLTTREISKLLKLHSIDLKNQTPIEGDLPFGTRSSAGKLFGVTGGVMEAAIRTAHYLVTGKDIKNHEIKELRGLGGVKETQIKINDLTIKVAVVNGLLNAKNILDKVQNGEKKYHFIEIMTCPGGCINGGGQPINIDKDNVKERMRALYKIDKEDPIKFSHKNPMIIELYKDFLGEPLSEKSHKILHTHYTKRKVVI